MSRRPGVSVIVPFVGSETQLAQLLRRLRDLHLGPEDELIVADNRATAASRCAPGRLRTVVANRVRTAAFARNRAAESASGEWLMFIDADTEPDPALLERYFDPPPRESTAILAGRILDVAGARTLSAGHSVARGQMSQEVTLRRSGAPYAQTANCAVRRSAFAAIGGFVDEARAGEDADLCFRLVDAGWELEERPCAAVSHRSRETVGALLGQLARHGSGAAWCERRHPGSFPAPSARELAARAGHSARLALLALIRGAPQVAGFAVLDLLGGCAFELGRLLPNRPRRSRGALECQANSGIEH